MFLKSIGYPTIESYWITGPSNGTPVYMLYNPNSYENFYTADAAEKDYLVTLGWQDRGIQFYATNGFRDSAPVYRLYNPNADGIGAHHYTDDAAERDWLVSLGWNDEGVAWYVAAKSDTGITVFGSQCLDYMMADKIGYTLKQTGYITDDGFEYDPNFYQKLYYVGVKK